MRKINFWMILIIMFAFFLAMPLSSAAHYINGTVNDARDGKDADGHTAILWNQANGIQDNLTDIIGTGGNSGTNNSYMIDCEMLSTPCDIGDSLKIKVLNTGDNYAGYDVSVTVSDAGYDLAGNITLNSPPNITLNFPINWQNLSISSIDLNCSVFDLDSGLSNITLYGNWSGGWHADETRNIEGDFSSQIFTKNLPEGIYTWNCYASDNLSIYSFYPENFTFGVDLSPPDITYVGADLSYSCGSVSTRVNCTVTDKMTSIDNVIIEAIKPSGTENFSTSLLSGDTYYSDILINEEGKWIFNCIANDSVGNSANLTSLEFNAYSSSPELAIYTQEILFSNINPVENEIVIVNATIYNLGCSNATNFSIAFYEDDPDNGGSQAGDNITLSLNSFSNFSVNVGWTAKIGTSKIFAYADINNSVSESNETNNKASREINVDAWQVFYGNASLGKILGNSYLLNMSFWTNETLVNGNLFITDKESRVGWLSLIALSSDINNNFAADDFNDADSILNMTGFSDSVSNVFSSGGSPTATENFSIYRRDIKNVPVINSTNNLNFRTGILWDSSDDSDGQYSQADREDLVFVAKINKGKQGDYGVYDYELRVPARLREYNDTDKNELYFYYDLN